MAKGSQAAKVGLFVVVSAGAVWLACETVRKDVGGSRGYTVHAYLKDASGLATHSRVAIAGIPVAQIESIKLEDGKARVDIKVKPDVVLWHNAKVGVRSASLLGENVLVITP